MSHLHRRAHQRRLHGQRHIGTQRHVALVMILTGLTRVAIEVSLLGLYVVGVPFIVHLFGSVAFVTVLSVLALILTDWSQVAASLAQLTAGDTHHDVEAMRVVERIDFRQLDEDIAELAELEPGQRAKQLAKHIHTRLERTGAL